MYHKGLNSSNFQNREGRCRNNSCSRTHLPKNKECTTSRRNHSAS